MDGYDSHPPLRARLAAAERLAIQSPSGDLNPALGLLNNADSEELRFLENANPNLPRNSLKRISWEEAGAKVLLASWVSWVSNYSSLLGEITAGNLFEALGRVPQIAPKIRDPKGMLLRPDQRIERARSLLATALGLTLVNNGWTLHSRPGEFYLSRGDEQVDPHDLVRQLSNGAISREAWAAKCTDMGIADISFASATMNDVKSSSAAQSGG